MKVNMLQNVAETEQRVKPCTLQNLSYYFYQQAVIPVSPVSLLPVEDW